MRQEEAAEDMGLVKWQDKVCWASAELVSAAAIPTKQGKHELKLSQTVHCKNTLGLLESVQHIMLVLQSFNHHQKQRLFLPPHKP